MTIYFIYSVAHLSSLFDGDIPVSIAGQAIISVSGNSDCTRCFARFMWSSVVIITKRFKSRDSAMLRIANAF